MPSAGSGVEIMRPATNAQTITRLLVVSQRPLFDWLSHEAEEGGWLRTRSQRQAPWRTPSSHSFAQELPRPIAYGTLHVEPLKEGEAAFWKTVHPGVLNRVP